MIIARVDNNTGRPFNVRLVRHGDSYGLKDRLIHDKDDPLIEFWDATYEHDRRFTPGLGQFVARYFLSTLTGKDNQRQALQGIVLCGHTPAWTVTGENVVAVVAAAKAALSTTAPPPGY